MAQLLTLPTHTNKLGSLTVIENIVPFEIKRIYYIYNATGIRGGHRHKKTVQALISVCGSCEIFLTNGKVKETYVLDSPEKCLIIQTEDWHTMYNFTANAVLLVLASELYDIDDYIDEEYA